MSSWGKLSLQPRAVPAQPKARGVSKGRRVSSWGCSDLRAGCGPTYVICSFCCSRKRHVNKTSHRTWLFVKLTKTLVVLTEVLWLLFRKRSYQDRFFCCYVGSIMVQGGSSFLCLSPSPPWYLSHQHRIKPRILPTFILVGSICCFCNCRSLPLLCNYR